MPIDNAVAVRFCNEVVRPLAEDFRALKARIDAALVTWRDIVSAAVPNDASLVNDKRDADGVSRLTGVDVNNFIALLQALQDRLNQTGVANVVSKPCVRTLEAR